MNFKWLKSPVFFVSLLSFIIFVFLFWIIYGFSLETSVSVALLPSFNALMNGLASIALVLGFRAIKRGNQTLHKQCMLTAFLFSFLFLVGYLVYHIFSGDTLFVRTDFLRPVYFFILISHILSTFVGLPLILLSGYYALTRQYTLHKKIARFTFPIWLYMSVTGVVIFLFLKFLNV